MDTTRVNIKTDTGFKQRDTTIIHHIIVKSTKQDGCNCWTNICDCKLLSELIWPITLLIIILLFYRKLRALLSNIGDRAKKIKIPGFELELEKLNLETASVENTITDTGSKRKEDKGQLHPYDFDYTITGDLPTEILKISIEIERALRSLFETKINVVNKRPLAIPQLIRTLRENKVIDEELEILLRKFWDFRNTIVHAGKYTVTKQEFLAFGDIGIRVLKILRTIQNNLANSTRNDDDVK